jgi:hypothetical protein
MGALARSAELGRAGNALSCAMSFPAVFGFKSCPLTFFSCVLVIGPCGETSPPWSVSCPTMRERTTKADCFARRSAFEEAAEGFFFALSVDDAGAVTVEPGFPTGESRASGLRSRLS